MSIETKTLTAEITANGVEEPIGQIDCAAGEKITILETGFNIPALGYIEGWIRNEKIDDVNFQGFPDVNNRVVRNNVLAPGDSYSFTGTDRSSAPNQMTIFIVFERIAG